ncbi:hypothetical protein [Sporosarcina thermotolerans]|uniref:hypothetical protein n=1 Tax=Sporosarcina thermotolerans TaxID=633404 RepID=UPI0036D2A765
MSIHVINDLRNVDGIVFSIVRYTTVTIPIYIVKQSKKATSTQTITIVRVPVTYLTR